MTLELLDHLVYAGTDLDALVTEFAERTGVQPTAGGAHPTGTANYLVAFTIDGNRGKHYLELIGPNPEADGPLPSTFGIDRLTEPRLAAWAIHPRDLDATVQRARDGGYDPGTIAPLSRRTPSGELLEWRLSKADPATADPLIPFLIDWEQTAHPGLGDLPTVELISLTGVHPDPESVRATLGLLGADLDVEHGTEPALRAVLRGPAGDVELR